MPKPELLVLWLSFLFIGPLIRFSRAEAYADVGTASHYKPPYTPNDCYGGDLSQFPTSNLIAAVGEDLWDNGAACGRQYLVKCISAAVPGTCIPGATVHVTIVGRAKTSISRPSREGSSLVLSDTAFRIIANSSVSYLNVEFKQL